MDDLIGWKDIANALGVTVRAAQRYATFNRDPLPCYRRLRTVCLSRPELEAWLDRHREPLADAVEPVVLVPADPRLAPLLRLFHRAALRALERAGAPTTAGTHEHEILVDEMFPDEWRGAPHSTRDVEGQGR